MRKVIPLFEIYWDEEDVRMTSEAIEKGINWAAGPNIETFERMIAEYINTNYCVVFNSGTSLVKVILISGSVGSHGA